MCKPPLSPVTAGKSGRFAHAAPTRRATPPSGFCDWSAPSQNPDFPPHRRLCRPHPLSTCFWRVWPGLAQSVRSLRSPGAGGCPTWWLPATPLEGGSRASPDGGALRAATRQRLRRSFIVAYGDGKAKKRRGLETPVLFEAIKVFTGGDDVVGDRNAQQLTRLVKLVRNRDIFARWLRIMTGVIVGNNDRGTALCHGSREHFARVDQRLIECAERDEV